MARDSKSQDLEQLLIDERERSAQHRQNFEKLKQEHVRLQADYVNLQKELKKALQATHDTRTNQAALLQKADRIISEKEMALVELREQVYSVNEDNIRKQVEEEMRAAFSAHVRQLRTELEKHRADLHHSSMTITSLRADIENSERIHQRAENELKMKFRSQMQQLEDELQSLRRRADPPNNSETLNQALAVQRDRVELLSRNKSLTAELRDIRKERDATVAEARAVTHLHEEKLAAAEEAKLVVELKLNTLQSQTEILEQTLLKSRTEVSNLVQQMSSIGDEKIKLKGQLMENERRYRAEISEARLQAAKQMAELQSGHEQTLTELTSARLEAELALKTADEQRKVLASKEEEFQQRLRASRVKDCDTIRDLESEKLLLQAQLVAEKSATAQAEQRALEAHAELKKEKDLQEKKRLEWQEEMSELRGKLKSKVSAIEDVEKLVGEKHALVQHIQLLQDERQKLEGTIREHLQQREALEKVIQELRLELQDTQIKVIKVHEGNEKSVAELKLAWEREKYDFVKQIEDLESELRHSHKEYDWKAATLKQKCKQRKKVIEAYKAKLKALEAAHNQIESEAAKMRQNVPADIHNMLQKELQELRRKQLEFRRIVDAAPDVDEMSSADDVISLGNKRKALCIIKEKVNRPGERQKSQNLGRLVQQTAALKVMDSSTGSDTSLKSSKEASTTSPSSLSGTE